MRLAIKNYKEFKQLSEETVAFAASLYFDGKKVADAKNDGHGGPNYYYFTDRTVEQEVWAFAKAWGAEHGHAFEPLDSLIAFLAEEQDHLKIAKQMAKKGLPATLLIETKQGWSTRCDYIGLPPQEAHDTAVHAALLEQYKGTTMRLIVP